MASPVRLYQKGMHAVAERFATWLPNDRIDLGEVGVLVKGRFEKRTTLRSLGIAFNRSKPTSPGTLNVSSTKGTKVAVGGGVGTIVPGTAVDVEVKFSANGAFLFQASGVRETRITNRAEVAGKIVRSFRAGKWKKEWRLIESLYLADLVTVIVSQSKSSSVSVHAQAKGPVGATLLADPNVKLTVSSESGKLLRFLGASKLRPLYRAARLQTHWFKDPELTLASLKSVAGPAKLHAAPIDELLNS